jgi:hypothetical protein
MKTYRCLPLFFSLLVMPCTFLLIGCKGNNHKNGLTDMNLKSKVKSVSETEFDAIDKVGIVEKGKESFTNYYLFDERGNKIEEAKYWKDELREKEIFRYDEENYLIESRRVFGLSHTHMFNTKSGQLNEVLLYKYYRDSSGKLTHSVIKPGSHESTRFGVFGDSSVYAYDEKERLIVKRNYQAGKQYYGNGKEVAVDHVTAYLYNQDEFVEKWFQGTEVYEELPNPEYEAYLKRRNGKPQLAFGFFGAKLGKVIRFDTTMCHFYYYKNRRLYKDVLTFANEASKVGAKFFVEKTYNEFGDVKEDKTWTPDVKAETITGYDPNTSTTFEYEYDQNNNWIKKVVYHNSIPRSIYERTYVYFE